MGFRARLASAIACCRAVPARSGGGASQPQDAKRVTFADPVAQDAAVAPEACPRRVKIEAPGDDGEASASAPAPNRKGRKATGGVTKEQLLQILVKAAEDDEEDAEEGQESDSGPDRARGSAEKRVTIQAPEDADQADEEDEPPPTRKGRKATGAVTQEQLRAALQQEDTDDEADDAAEAGLESRSRRVKIVAPELADSADSSDGRALPAPKRRGRRATGVVTKQQLQEITLQDDADEAAASDGEDSEEDEAPARRSQGRKGTGYVTKQDLEALAKEEDSVGDRSDRDGRMAPDIKAQDRKVRIQVANDDPASGDEERPRRRPAGRKGTGYVTKRDLDAVQRGRVQFQSQEEEESQFPTILDVPRRRGRKATGAVTKEQLIQAMTAADSDGKTVSISPTA